jgi:hypothetical protein
MRCARFFGKKCASAGTSADKCSEKYLHAKSMSSCCFCQSLALVYWHMAVNETANTGNNGEGE